MLYLPSSYCSATQTAQKMAPGTGTDAPPVAQRLFTHTWPKTSPAQYIQANKDKH